MALELHTVVSWSCRYDECTGQAPGSRSEKSLLLFTYSRVALFKNGCILESPKSI